MKSKHSITLDLTLENAARLEVKGRELSNERERQTERQTEREREREMKGREVSNGATLLRMRP